jgi:hypothetical protein
MAIWGPLKMVVATVSFRFTLDYSPQEIPAGGGGGGGGGREGGRKGEEGGRGEGRGRRVGPFCLGVWLWELVCQLACNCLT